MGNLTAAKVSVGKTLAALLALFSLAASAFLTFDATTVAEFLSSGLLLGAVIFSTLYLLALSVRYLTGRDTKKAARAALGALAVPIVSLAIWASLGTHDLSVPPPFYPHFRTNILTGRCDFGTGRSPWYQRAGCALPRAEKIRLVKESRHLYYRPFCTTQCKGDIANCPQVKPIPGEDILCSDLMR